MMLILRCTAKLRKEMGLKEAALYEDEPPSSPLDTWFANLLHISRRKCVLFTQHESLFSFLTFDASKARLKNMDAVFRDGLMEAMTREGFDSKIISRLMGRYEDVRFARTNSRKVLGSMNDIASLYKYHILNAGGLDYIDLPDMILRLNRVPFLPLGAQNAIEKFSGQLGIDRTIHLEELFAHQTGSGAVYQIKVTLQGSEPAIWRRLLVQDTTLDRLSDFLITAMGWTDSHLHMFTVGGKHYSLPDPEWYDEDLMDERTVKLSDIVSEKQHGFIYEYDLGDSWQHDVLIENVEHPEPGRRYPVCLEGSHACPPEDVGGIGGFYEFLQTIADPDHPEHQNSLEWAGGNFDPEVFDLDKTNRALMTKCALPSFPTDLKY